MKLVDILARELKVWPEGAMKLSQSFAGMIFYLDEVGQVVPLVRSDVADDWREVDITRAQWQAVVDALKAESAPAWVGVGLPPVGTVCEFRVEEGDWRQCEVISHKAEVAVCWIHCNKIFSTGGASVRPIRTPEQIAAEEQEKFIDEMAWLTRLETPESRLVFRMIYDAGYRKQENNQ